MAIWKIIIYPFGLALLGFLLVSCAATLTFGSDPREWFDWQNHLASALGAGIGMAGFVGGMYIAMKAVARLVQ